jgi:polysaccharide chain length determinant protein (PEP-CTERM system associated)
VQSWKIQLLTYLSNAWRYRWWGVAGAWGICVIGWAGIALLPDRYQSEAKVYIDTDTLMRPLLKGLAVSTDPDQEVSVMLRTLVTTPNVEQVIRMTDMNSTSISTSAMQDKVTAIQQQITLRSFGAKNLFGISFTDANPTYAQAVTQSLVSILVDSNIGNQRKDVEGVQSFIDERVAEYERLLRAAEKRRADFKAANLEFFSSGPVDDRLDKAQAAVLDAQSQLDAATIRRDNLSAQLTSTQAILNVDAPNSVVINGAQSDGPYAELQRARQELVSLKAHYTDEYPDVVAKKKLIARLQTEVAGDPKGQSSYGSHQGISNPVYVSIKGKLSDEETNVALQQHRLVEGKANLIKMQQMAETAISVERQYADLDRDYQVLHENYQQLLSRREAARLSQAVGDQQSSTVFRIVDPPQKPDHPVAPNRILFNTLVLLAGLAGGFSVAILLGMNADRFSVSEQLSAAFAIPILGAVSLVHQAADLSRRRSAIAGISLAMGVLLLGYIAVLLIFHTSVQPKVEGFV